MFFALRPFAQADANPRYCVCLFALFSLEEIILPELDAAEQFDRAYRARYEVRMEKEKINKKLKDMQGQITDLAQDKKFYQQQIQQQQEQMARQQDSIATLISKLSVAPPAVVKQAPSAVPQGFSSQPETKLPAGIVFDQGSYHNDPPPQLVIVMGALSSAGNTGLGGRGGGVGSLGGGGVGSLGGGVFGFGFGSSCLKLTAFFCGSSCVITGSSGLAGAVGGEGVSAN